MIGVLEVKLASNFTAPGFADGLKLHATAKICLEFYKSRVLITMMHVAERFLVRF